MIRGSILTLPQRARVIPDVAVRVLAQAAERRVREAAAAWPVRTGYSRARLSSRLEGRRVVIRGSADYTRAIVSRGIRPWQRLVLDPTTQYLRRDGPRKIGREIVASLRVTRGG